MSDTDDTDLLLLIPPDFFLVHSPDLTDFDSDCDTSFRFEHNDVQDSIVSDLITQVNDLESRVCMIENSDRSATQYSSYYEDTLANQSINSLTESDILRAQFKEKSDLLALDINNKPMQKSLTEDENHAGLHKCRDSLSTQGNISDNLQPDTKNTDGLAQSKSVKSSEHVKDKLSVNNIIDNEDKTNDKDIHLNKSNQADLLSEVDAFLDIKNKQKSITVKGSYRGKELELESDAVGSGLPLISDKLIINLGSDSQVSEENHSKNQSLPLPEVYQLLKEMEETQSEMEKKLKRSEAQSKMHVYETNDSAIGLSRNKLIENSRIVRSSNVLGLEDLKTKALRPVSYKQTESVLDRIKNSQDQTNNFQNADNPINSKHAELNYLFTSTPHIFRENISNLKDSRQNSESPRRNTLSRNTVDVVNINRPRKDTKTTNSLIIEEAELPSKSVDFRRGMNFERPNFPPRSLKSRPLFMEQNQTSDRPFVNHQNNDDARTNVHFLNRNNTKSSHSIEEKMNSLALQRAKIDQSLLIENKCENNEVLQQKISSRNLLSLSELWNKEPTFYSDDPNKLRQKLEEEKYRRQHCEQQIQVLQLRVLEEQEKLAVAIKVDQEKDKAILQITESWRKLNDHWSELEEQRHSLAQQLQDEKEAAKIKSDELSKKVERWEKEVSQALDLAAGYKEKSENIQQQMETLKQDNKEKLQTINTQIKNISDENIKTEQEKKSLLKQIKSFQERIKEEEELLSKLKIELEKTKCQVSEYEAEVSILKEQKESLTSKVRDEKNRNSILEQQINSLQQAMNDAIKKEKAAQDEARMSNERIEVARTELRALYQGQLETVVKEKLQEFQNQLEAAEAALKAELHSKEKQWADKASSQCRHLQEKYKIDLQRIEEFHREEKSKWKEQLIESERLRSIVESKLQEETNRRADIAQRLHSVMETQWREALNIISNPMQNVYELSKGEHKNRWPADQQSSEKLKGSGDLRISRSNSVTSLAQVEDAPFCKEGLVTCRTSQPTQDHQLKKYIQMLLERGPGNPVPQHDSLQESIEQIYSLDGSLHGSRWIQDDVKKTGGQMERLERFSKPPWK